MSKMVFMNEFVPNEKEAIKSILDYEIEIHALRPEQTHYMALGMNYSVAGFQVKIHNCCFKCTSKKLSHFLRLLLAHYKIKEISLNFFFAFILKI